MAARKKKMATRVVNLVHRSDGSPQPSPQGRIMVSPQTALVVRNLAKHTKLSLDDLVQWMVQDFVPRNTPELSLVMDDGSVQAAGRTRKAAFKRSS